MCRARSIHLADAASTPGAHSCSIAAGPRSRSFARPEPVSGWRVISRRYQKIAIRLRRRLVHPYIALLDTLDERLRIEFAKVRGDHEQARGLRPLLKVLNSDGHAIFDLDSQREFELGVDPTNDVPSRGRYGPVDSGVAPVDEFFANMLTPPRVARVTAAGEIRHGLPLPAGVARIDRNKQLGQPARLPGIHKNPLSWPRKIGGVVRFIGQKEAVRKIGRFDTHLVVKDTEFASRRGRRAVNTSGDEIGRKLLRLRRGVAAHQNADETQQAPHRA